jgi:putative N6-adenine-specific DNA methylase
MAGRRDRQARYIVPMPDPDRQDCFAITPPGVEHLTAAELAGLGIGSDGTEPGGVAFRATTRQLYAANLELRTASRIVVRLAEFPARAFYELERKAGRVPWDTVLAPGAPVRFRVSSRKSRLYHLDGIAQRLAAVAGAPADGEADDEAQLFLVRVLRDVVTISADSSGALLHRRGYRLATAKAPLRETLAAAMLLGAGDREDWAFVDPFCGAGTLPIEAALLRRRIAPGLLRSFGFARWPGYDAETWRGLREEARLRILPRAGAPIQASDRDAGAIEAAVANAERAGVAEDIAFEQRPFSKTVPPAPTGLLATNPPYGIRVGDRRALRDLYRTFGALAAERWAAWTVALLSADAGLLAETTLSTSVRWSSSNGGIPVQLVVRS